MNKLLWSIALHVVALCFCLSSWAGEGAWALPDPASRPHPAAGTSADPATYPDTADFQKRREALLSALAKNDLSKWRRGYFAGGDPGKYLPGAAMAKLLIDPSDAEARKFMNDERSPKEHYHFAAINWARFLPVFGEALTPETRATLAAQASKYSAYLSPSGTENHRTMNLCAACVLPEYLEGGRLAHKDKQEALSSAKRQLRDYVKGLYAAGQGEWDSPTYLMFDLHGMLNIYDFSSDPELRLLAAAALDWFTAAYALKYRDGIFAGPNQRGYYDKAVNSIADQTGWLWWGSSVNPDPGSFYFAIHPATSSWKPNAILTKLARKDVPGLPVTFQNTKPNYWFGHGVSPKAGEYSESLHVSKSFTLGSLWNGFGGQITRFHLVANGPQPLALTGGHPRKSDHTGKRLDELTFRDGGGRYDQSIQTGPLYVSMSRIPEDEPIDYSFVSLPEGITPKKIGDLWVLRFGDAWVAVRPLGRESELADRPLSEKEASVREKALAAGKSEPVPQILKMSGRPTGFALIAGESADWPSEEDFVRWVSNTYRWDDSKFQTEMTLGIRLCEEREIVMTHDAESSRARVTGLKAPAGAVYDGPFVKLKDQVLEISDGSKGYAVDFRGDLPVYRELP